MIKKQTALLLGSVLLFAACESKPVEKSSQFWQRISVSDAIYQQGPKAQQMLNRDISRCVFELRELERLGNIKNAIPTDLKGRVIGPDQRALENWDTPERDKHLLAEHSDYTDFESCMKAKGWERVEHVPFDVARKGRDNYKRAHVDYGYEPENFEQKSSKRSVSSNDSGDFSHLND